MNRDKAIVVGGGFSGLVAARVLSEHFKSVIVFEKDPKLGSSSPRTGVPQGSHLHVLLQRGQEILGSLFPGIEGDFRTAGCPRIDWAADTRWETERGAFPRYPSKVQTHSFTRPLLESVVHARVAKLGNVSFHSGRVESLEGLKADLIVLAAGQNFSMGRAGNAQFEAETRSLPIQITYRSAFFRLNELELGDAKQYYYQFSPPHDRLGAVVCPVEKGLAVVTLIEYGSEQVSRMDAADFMELAKRVPNGEIARILHRATPVSAVSVFQKPSMSLRRLDRVANFPGNVFVIGDAFCSLNPVFGQGMTLALEQVLLLGRSLKSRKSLHSRTFHRQSAKLARLPFLLSKVGSSTVDGIAERILRSFLVRCQRSAKRHENFLNLLHMKGGYGPLLRGVL